MMLRTSRLTLRAFVPEDWQALFEYLSDPVVVRYEPYAPFTKSACIIEALHRAQDDRFVAVCLTETGKLIGNLYLHKHPAFNAELGYVFHRAFWGKGYASEAASALLTHVFSLGEIHRVYAMCNPQNISSVALLQRIGMRQEAHLLQNESFHKDASGQPIWQDTLIYAILREEWKSRQP